ncbi:MAG: hypothetical protein ACI4US_06410 [Muribaculaceae bacterium]
MKNLIYVAAFILISAFARVSAQTLDVAALEGFSPSTVVRVYDVSRYVKLDAGQQKALAAAIEKADAKEVAMIKAADGVLTTADSRKVEKQRHKMLAGILSTEQMEQYYRGVFDSEADAEGIAIANRLQKKYNLTDQNWKFIRIAFYKIALDSRVINAMMADQPAKAKKNIEKLREEQLATIEAKGGIRVNPAGTTVTVIKPFDPNTLHKD